MFKVVFLMIVMSMSCVFANDSVSSVISDIEYNKSAKCEFINSSSAFCLSFLCFSKKVYTCTSNSSDFTVEIKIKESTVSGAHNYTKVRSVKIIE